MSRYTQPNVTRIGGRPTVGLLHPLQFPEVDATLRSFARVEVAASPSADHIAALAPKVDALIARSAKVTEGFIAAAHRLQVISVTGSGVDLIDVNAATRHGIPVTNGAGVAPQGVAEYVLGSMIVGHRQLVPVHDALLDGTLAWSARVSTWCPPGLHGGTLGLVGFGQIARNVAAKARAALDMDVVAYDPFVDQVPGVRMVRDIADVFDGALVVSVHAPLLPTTRGLVTADLLRRLGPEGLLVNTSRGGVVDERAMLHVLRTGELGGAWVDVFDPEPPTPAQLAAFRATPNLFVTPHVAGITQKVRQALEANAVEQVRRVLQGQPPTTAVNGAALRELGVSRRASLVERTGAAS